MDLDVKGHEVVDWLNLVQDMDQKQFLVNTEMNLPIT